MKPSVTKGDFLKSMLDICPEIKSRPTDPFVELDLCCELRTFGGDYSVVFGSCGKFTASVLL